MSVEQLVNNYFDEIEVESTDYVDFTDAKHDVAYILLRVPTAMLKDFLRLKEQKRELPDGTEFWKETGLVNRLRNSGKYYGQGHEDLDDILDFLGGEVQVNYQPLDTEKTRLHVIEIPREFYGEE
ncbi:MAG: hypothetical protein AABW89_01945 [Nanoarchaeota archaeon]